jgi:hypothetical protein
MAVKAHQIALHGLTKLMAGTCPGEKSVVAVTASRASKRLSRSARDAVVSLGSSNARIDRTQVGAWLRLRLQLYGIDGT